MSGYGESVFATPAPASGTLAISTRRARYHGYALRDSGGAGAVVRIWDSPSAASGTILDTINLAAGESAAPFYEKGIEAQTGIFVQVVSGTVEGSIRIG